MQSVPNPFACPISSVFTPFQSTDIVALNGELARIVPSYDDAQARVFDLTYLKANARARVSYKSQNEVTFSTTFAGAANTSTQTFVANGAGTERHEITVRGTAQMSFDMGSSMRQLLLDTGNRELLANGVCGVRFTISKR